MLFRSRNFNRPYLSQSYGEFFRRWHISLNRWFTNYLYIPLGGGRRGTGRKMLNTLIVFALCGLWHGARWTYVLWGLYAAFFVCLESLLKKPAEQLVKKLSLPLESPLVILFRRFYMFLIFIPAALIFRSESIEQLSVLLRRLFTAPADLPGAFQMMGLNGFSLITLALTLTAMNAMHVWSDYDLPEASTEIGASRRLVSAVYCVAVIALSWLALLATQDAAGFAYFQF